MWANHCHTVSHTVVSPFPSNIAAAQPVQSRVFRSTRTVHHNSMVHLPFYGVFVPIFMQLVFSICVPVAITWQALSLILPAVKDSAFTSSWRSQQISAILSKHIFQSNMELSTQNILRVSTLTYKSTTKGKFLVKFKFTKSKFLLNFSAYHANFLWNFLATKGTYLPWRYRTLLEWPASRRRHAADSEVPCGPLRTEATPFGEAHIVALGPEIAKTCLSCPSVTVWHVTHFRAYFCAAFVPA